MSTDKTEHERLVEQLQNPDKPMPSGRPCKVCREPIEPRWMPDFSALLFQRESKGGKWIHSVKVCEACKRKQRNERRDEMRQIAFKRWCNQLRSVAGSYYADSDYKPPQKMVEFLETALRTARSDRRAPFGAYLHGPVDTLKTLNIVTSIREIYRIEAGALELPDDRSGSGEATPPGILYTSEVEMLKAIMPSGPHTIERYKQAPVLVLDDLGCDRVTDFRGTSINELLDYRQSHCMPTVFISNYSLEDLAKHSELYDSRAMKRIRILANERFWDTGAK